MTDLHVCLPSWNLRRKRLYFCSRSLYPDIGDQDQSFLALHRLDIPVLAGSRVYPAAGSIQGRPPTWQHGEKERKAVCIGWPSPQHSKLELVTLIPDHIPTIPSLTPFLAQFGAIVKSGGL